MSKAQMPTLNMNPMTGARSTRSSTRPTIQMIAMMSSDVLISFLFWLYLSYYKARTSLGA